MHRLTHPHGRPGAAVVEFAVVLPLLLATVFGIIEFGRMMMVQQVLTSAAREGTRIGVLPGATSDDVAAQVEASLVGTGLTGVQVDLDPEDPGEASADDPITVTLTVSYENVSWLVGFLPLEGRVMQATSVMRREADSSD